MIAMACLSLLSLHGVDLQPVYQARLVALLRRTETRPLNEQGELTISYSLDGARNRTTQTGTCRYAMYGKKLLVESQFETEAVRGVGQLFCVNDAYTFKLSRVDDNWQLEVAAPNRRSRAFSDQRLFMLYFERLYAIDRIAVSDLIVKHPHRLHVRPINQTDWQVDGYQVIHNDRLFHEIRFNVRVARSSEAAALTSAFLLSEDGTRLEELKLECELAEREGMLGLRSFREVRVTTIDPDVHRSEIHCDFAQVAPLGEAETETPFTLEHYGISPPDWSRFQDRPVWPVSATRTRYWYAGAVALVLVFVMWCGRRPLRRWGVVVKNRALRIQESPAQGIDQENR